MPQSAISSLTDSLTDDPECELLAPLGLRVDLALVARRVRHPRRADRHRPEVAVVTLVAVLRDGDARVRRVNHAAHRQDVHVPLPDPGNLQSEERGQNDVTTTQIWFESRSNF